MIVLDTNIIYYLCDLSPSPIPLASLKKYLDCKRKTEELCISSVSLYEIIARYNKHANEFRRIICTFKYYNIQLIDDGHYGVFAPLKKEVRKIRQNRLNELWYGIKKYKIDVESRYTAAVFHYVFASSIIFSVVDDIENVPDAFLLGLKATLKFVQEFVLDIFKETFSEGYNTDDCENIVKFKFSQLLEHLLPASISICKKFYDSTIDSSGDIKTPFDDENYFELFKDLSRKIKKRDRTMQFVTSIATVYSHKSKDKQLKKYLSNIDDTIDHVFEQEAMKEYIFEIVNKCLLNAGEFWKNSINDAFILSTIGENDILISFDNGVRKHMENYKDTKPNYKNSVDEINKLLLSK